MDNIRVYGNIKLDGEIKIQGCKNSVLPILAATLLNGKTNIIHNCPGLSDVFTTIKILESLGCTTQYVDGCAFVDSGCLSGYTIDSEMMSKLRASIVFAAPLLSRCGKAEFTMPGGCNIGTRPIDIHLAAFEKMGVDVECTDGNVKCKVNELHSADIYLPLPSVGATENVMLLASKGKGITRIYNPAREPEIYDLQQFLNSMGAKIFGAGTDLITIYAADDFNDSNYTVMPDRIEAITYACACASSGGIIRLDKINYNHISSVMNVLCRMGVKIVPYTDSMMVISNKKIQCPGMLSTRPYPGFPTDAQSLLMSVMSSSEGVGVIVENIFENRLNHAYELNKMGADIRIQDNKAIIRGTKLHGADTQSQDLRSGAALVVAALGCDDLTTVSNCDYIDRGYENFTQKLHSLGAKLERA